MSAELVRRLRLGFFSDVATEIASKAADEIERLTAERDALSAQLRAAHESEPVADDDDETCPECLRKGCDGVCMGDGLMGG